MGNIGDTLMGLLESTGFTKLYWGNYVMILVALVFLYLAIVKGYEPLLLVPISFGMLLVNLCPGIMAEPYTTYYNSAGEMVCKLTGNEYTNALGEIITQPIAEIMATVDPSKTVETAGGLLHYFFMLDELAILPCLIFMGVGAMTDFGPLIANPKSFLLGAAAQLGIFAAYFFAIIMGFNGKAAAAISIIGGADGPTSIFLAMKLGQTQLMGPIAVAAYSYMSLVPIIQPPIMKLLTTEKERKIKMEQLRPVSKLEKVLFPIIVTIVVVLILPDTAALVGSLMLGNLFRESGVVKQLQETASNALMYIVVILLGTSVGATTSAQAFLRLDTIKIVGLGLIAFAIGTAGGTLFGKLMCKATKGKINPLIGSAGVSAVPMAARVSQKVGAEADPSNFLLMHAMGPNVAGVIGTAVAAGVFMAIFGV
ncbi:MAG: sodium ion-translocating decarboxylase subunit beta [Lachnospiraceae bacterium]|nr:sodium ion-translocating decarboxylase subunit beta [Lachnospiraceae bacterium]